ncbi:MAG TPA: type IV toxin-antitoxin system AbiEi family antitoxin domain-containing protein [Acidobacteriota bacterium]|jgi:predicted transcriptional regulator of viral defense system|nr:type IV toxin-antitoxin system AbiEi family antitoxin domain-containing protein [Acidobacteriota bacterium]
MKQSSGKVGEAKAIFRGRRRPLRTTEAIRLGIHPRTLYAMRDQGIIEPLGRGLYRLSGQPLANPDLVTVALKISNGVICLISALAFHEMTTQVPHEVYVAVLKGAEPPRLRHPPVRVFWFSGRAFSEGIETHAVDRVPVRVYSAEKTLADCFKYRNKIGLDTAVEALKLYRRRKSFSVERLLRYARICRVEKVLRPYLEAVL